MYMSEAVTRCMAQPSRERPRGSFRKSLRIRSETIAKLLYDFDNQGVGGQRGNSARFRLDSRSVLIIDEAGMVGSRHLHRLLAEVERSGAKIILVGDDKQLQSIDAGGGFAGLSRRFGYSELKEIRRQKSARDRAAVYDLASGDRERIELAIRDFSARGRLLTEEGRERVRLRLVSDWGRDPTAPEEKLVLTSTNAEASALNRMIQEERQQSGELGDVFAEVAGERVYLGDRVLFTKRRKAYGGRDAIENGMLGTVEAFDPVSNRLTVRIDGKEKERTVSVDLSEYDSLRLGYAVTTHKAQGVTIDSSYVLLGSKMTDAQAGYVQASRHRKEYKLYVSRDDAGDYLEDLIADMSRDRRKRLAHDETMASPETKPRVSNWTWPLPGHARGISIELRP